MLEPRGRGGGNGERIVLSRVHPEGRARLGIQINENDLLAVLIAGDGKRGGEGGLADTPFLRHERKNLHRIIHLYRCECIHTNRYRCRGNPQRVNRRGGSPDFGDLWRAGLRVGGTASGWPLCNLLITATPRDRRYKLRCV